MQKMLKLSGGALLFLFLVGCDKKQETYPYLMQHPSLLQKEFARCQDSQNTDESSCAVVRNATHDFSELLHEQSDNPELFGRQIMRAQTELVRLADERDRAEQAYRQQGLTPALKTKWKLAEKAYLQQAQKIWIYYAVVASTSPEA